MSHVSDSVSVYLYLADYLATDASGKLNMIGGNIMLLGFDPQAGATAGFAVCASIRGDQKLNGEEFTFEMVLVDQDSKPVAVAGPAGPQVMRIGNNMQFNSEPAYASRGLQVQENVVVGFSVGLPLRPGSTYAWKVRIDGAEHKDWMTTFHIPSPSTGPVIG